MNIAGVPAKKLWVPGLLLIILVLLATLTLYASAYAVILLTSIMMYVVLTVSWAIFSGPTGYISLATAAFFGVGVYTSALLGSKLPLPIVVLVGGLASSCLAVLVGALTLRLKDVYFTFFTFGLLELIKYVLLWYEVEFTGTRGRFVIVVDNNTIYHVMLVILLALLITAYLIRRSRWGLALQSIGENEEAAAHMGVNVTAVKVIIFGISAIFVGSAGSIMATRWTYIDPYIAFNLLLSFMAVLMAIFGGVGQLSGPIVGAAAFAYLEEVLITKFPYYYRLLFGLIFIIVVLYLPNGLVGLVQKWQKRRMEGQHATA
jgi:branched-chain amino acid transport system permease protein